MKRAASLGELFAALDEGEARTLITQALAAKSVAPFEMKGARQGRIVAETIVELDGVPEPFVACSASWSPGSKAAIHGRRDFDGTVTTLRHDPTTTMSATRPIGT